MYLVGLRIYNISTVWTCWQLPPSGTWLIAAYLLSVLTCLKREAVGSFKTCVTFRQTTRRHIPEHSIFIVMAVNSLSHKASHFRLQKGKQLWQAKWFKFTHKRITWDCWPTCLDNHCHPTADPILLHCSAGIWNVMNTWQHSICCIIHSVNCGF